MKSQMVDLGVLPLSSKVSLCVEGQSLVVKGRKNLQIYHHLTYIQFQILWILVKRTGNILSRADIERLIYLGQKFPANRRIDTHVCRLRAVLREVGQKYLKALHGTQGKGYQWKGIS